MDADGTKASPLVSIGVPTFNRPDLLQVALEHLVAQTHKNIEIVISDNSSPDPSVQKVIEQFSERDGRIRSTRQVESIGAAQNFIFVLRESRGEYFMWAADDDYFEPWFIERCLQQFERAAECALVATEAQYFVPVHGKFDFIAEGRDFRRPVAGSKASRIEHLLANNYGNLIYGLFRRTALIRDSEVLWEKTLLSSLNEIAPLLLAADAGEIVVLPEVGLFKNAPRPVYDQVVWEINGGRHPTGPCLDPRALIGTFRYHWKALQDIYSAIELTTVSIAEQRSLRTYARDRLTSHFFNLAIGYKRQRSTGAPT